MADKQNIPINFAQGLNTKTDPWQLAPGQFLALQNSIFDKGGMLQKRNGYGPLTALPTFASYLTTLSDNLTTVSSTIQSYDAGTKKWTSKGTYEPMAVSTLPLIRNSTNQTQCDSAVAPNGLVCTAYTDNDGTAATVKFVIANSTTGQNIVAPQSVPIAAGTVTNSPRVFLLGNWFVIVVTNLVSSSNFLQYVAININNIFDPSGALVYTTQRVTASAYTPTATVSWDGVVANGQLFIAFNSLTGGQSIKVTYLTAPLIASAQTGVTAISFTSSTDKATIMSLCADVSNPTAIQIYISFWNASNDMLYSAAVTTQLATVYGPTAIDTINSTNLASAAQGGVCTIFSEVPTNYSYDSSIPTHAVNFYTITSAGTTTGIPTISALSVGLASKAFIVAGSIYYLSAYSSPFQPTYFLINGSASTANAPIVVAKLAYENGGGYLPTGLPGVTVVGSLVRIAYLNKDLVQALTTVQNTTQTTTGGVYSQTGINLANFNFQGAISTAEIASNLHIGGGFLWAYDGYLPVEHNFFLWPDSIECTWSTTGGAIAAQPDGSTNINAYFCQAVYEWSDNAGNVYRSAPSIPVAVTTTGTGTTGSITVNVPTLRLTYKTANPVKICVYRWSVANPVYHEVTSVSAPTLNTMASNSIAFVDKLADASIEGNAIIYTTGGVVEDVNAPATSIMSLFDTRLWLVDAEDPNLLWFSKQVIEAVPVEMSDLLTFYVAPTTGSQGSTGPITALAPMDDKLVVFKENAIYYINGTGPDITGASNQYTGPVFITSTVGCINTASIVFMPNGLMFQSDKGIWLLDRGMGTSYIGAPVETFTQNAIVQSALNIPSTNQVRFTLDTGITLMYDYFFQQWGTFQNVPAVAACLYQGLHTYLNKQGGVLQETPGVYLDNGEPTLIAFATGWFNLASLQGFERAYYFYLLGRYLSPHKLDIGIAYNYVSGAVSTRLITPDNYSSAVPSPFGDQSAPFGSPIDVEQWRVFFQQQKCQSFQITLQEIFDPSLGVPAGAGFTLSGISLQVAAKRGLRPLPARKSVG